MLDGYDELPPTQRTKLHREFDSLDRFALTTRTAIPQLNRTIDAVVTLLRINLPDAINYLDEAFSADVRDRVEKWANRDEGHQQTLEYGLMLAEAARLAHSGSSDLHLTDVLDRSITRQMDTHIRLHAKGPAKTLQLVRSVAGELAKRTLKASRETPIDRMGVSRKQFRVEWDNNSLEPFNLFEEVVQSTGLMVEDGGQLRFWCKLVRDELAAERFIEEDLKPTGLASYPHYQRVLTLWATKLMRANRASSVITMLKNLQDSEADPYRARWSVMVGILTHCLPFNDREINAIRDNVEQALIVLWNATSSNRMKARIADDLKTIGAGLALRDPDSSDMEQLWPDFDTTLPDLDIPALLATAGRNDLAQQALRKNSKNDRTITLALINAMTLNDETLARAAAHHLVHRDLKQQTVMDFLSRSAPIDQLVDLALTLPAARQASTQEYQRAKLAQTAGLAILSRPEVLTQLALLKRIPNGVIHTLMATLNIRVLMKNDGPVVITADGREWPARLFGRTAV